MKINNKIIIALTFLLTIVSLSSCNQQKIKIKDYENHDKVTYEYGSNEIKDFMENNQGDFVIEHYQEEEYNYMKNKRNARQVNKSLEVYSFDATTNTILVDYSWDSFEKNMDNYSPFTLGKKTVSTSGSYQCLIFKNKATNYYFYLNEYRYSKTSDNLEISELAKKEVNSYIKNNWVEAVQYGINSLYKKDNIYTYLFEYYKTQGNIDKEKIGEQVIQLTIEEDFITIVREENTFQKGGTNDNPIYVKHNITEFVKITTKEVNNEKYNKHTDKIKDNL